VKLIGDFFSIQSNLITEAGFITTININPNHLIYSCHFPGFPVTPGVVQIQIVHELLENHLRRVLKLVSMPQCKFITLLNPTETSCLDVHIGYRLADSLLDVVAQGKNQKEVFFKLNSIYQFKYYS
jgi:3-hydroxyacyl-[acyl-carrier-protein] dehydratase